VEYAGERVAFDNVADKRRCQAEDQRDHADSSRSHEGSTRHQSSTSQEDSTRHQSSTSQEDSTRHQSSTSQEDSTRQESNGRKRWKGQVVWGEDNQGQGWEEEEEKEKEKVWFTIKVKSTPGACPAQFDFLEIISDGQSSTVQAASAAPAPWLAD